MQRPLSHTQPAERTAPKANHKLYQPGRVFVTLSMLEANPILLSLSWLLWVGHFPQLRSSAEDVQHFDRHIKVIVYEARDTKLHRNDAAACIFVALVVLGGWIGLEPSTIIERAN